ncbi:hypothetical protein [uncultured Jatrophihabitans sp.]|uniref:hypothetical protein n=1 Tax=uncultured Jatrophihabitans sp. TaxID=1610747 RepID=UPI0035C9CFD5
MSKHEGSESDTKPDDKLAESRETGGVPDADDPNQGSTTSTTPDGEYVGRVAGDDVGYAGETGAEARSNDS